MERKVPRSFVDGGVGLGIVAAMTHSGGDRTREWTSHLAAAASMRSSPIPIISLAKPAAADFNSVGLSPPRREIVGSEAGSVGSGSVSLVDESDEFYTCVVSHVGNQKVISKFVYYGDKVSGFRDDPVAVFDVNPGMFYASSSPLVINPGGGGDWRSDSRNQDFLASCHLCKKLLHGLDIFMYRGEKAFCSVECRGKQIRLEKRKEKYGGEVRKPHDCSLSPCSSPQVYLAEVAAA